MNKLSLNSVEWKEFIVQDIFEVINSKPYHKDNLRNSKYGIEYVTRTSLNNGVECIVENSSDYILNKGNCISLGAENTDFFYHENDYISGNKMYMIRHEKMNKYSGLFLVKVFKNSIKNSGFGYGQGLTGTRFKTRKILLPIDEKGEPNWEFMENYIKQIMNRQKSQIISYYKSQLSDIAYGGGDLQNSDIEWKEFTIGNVFDIVATSSGIDKNKLKLGDGKTPYITRSDLNNGINLFIPYKQDSKYKMDCGNLITIGLDTQTVFYQNCEFYTGQNIQIAKHLKLNKYNAFFFIPLIKKQMEKFNWGGNGATLTRLKRTKILLPIDEKGEPNWKYMENYVKQKFHSQAKQIINYYES